MSMKKSDQLTSTKLKLALASFSAMKEIATILDMRNTDDNGKHVPTTPALILQKVRELKERAEVPRVVVNLGVFAADKAPSVDVAPPGLPSSPKLILASPSEDVKLDDIAKHNLDFIHSTPPIPDSYGFGKFRSFKGDGLQRGKVLVTVGFRSTHATYKVMCVDADVLYKPDPISTEKEISYYGVDYVAKQIGDLKGVRADRAQRFWDWMKGEPRTMLCDFGSDCFVEVNILDWLPGGRKLPIKVQRLDNKKIFCVSVRNKFKEVS